MGTSLRGTKQSFGIIYKRVPFARGYFRQQPGVSFIAKAPIHPFSPAWAQKQPFKYIFWLKRRKVNTSRKLHTPLPVSEVCPAKPREHFLYQKYTRQNPASISCIKSMHGKTPRAFPVSKVCAANSREHFLYQKYTRQKPASISCIKSTRCKTPRAFLMSEVDAEKFCEHFLSFAPMSPFPKNPSQQSSRLADVACQEALFYPPTPIVFIDKEICKV